MRYAAIAVASLLTFGCAGASAAPVPRHTVRTPHVVAPVTCESIGTVIKVNDGMPANYDFKLCGVGMPKVTIGCINGLPQPGQSTTCTVTPAKK